METRRHNSAGYWGQVMPGTTDKKLDKASLVYTIDLSPLLFNLIDINTKRSFDDIKMPVEGQNFHLARLCGNGKIAIRQSH
jgi:hypothetical protein